MTTALRLEAYAGISALSFLRKLKEQSVAIMYGILIYQNTLNGAQMESANYADRTRLLTTRKVIPILSLIILSGCQKVEWILSKTRWLYALTVIVKCTFYLKRKTFYFYKV